MLNAHLSQGDASPWQGHEAQLRDRRAIGGLARNGRASARPRAARAPNASFALALATVGNARRAQDGAALVGAPLSTPSLVVDLTDSTPRAAGKDEALAHDEASDAGRRALVQSMCDEPPCEPSGEDHHDCPYFDSACFSPSDLCCQCVSGLEVDRRLERDAFCRWLDGV